MCTFLCCEGKILQRVTYEDALVNVDKLNTFFRLHIKEKSCILLLMEQSVHIPAIIMSLKACGHCFVPFSTSAKRKEIQDLVEEAEIQFVLSFVKELTPVENFQFIDDIHLGRKNV
ncbi:hypothetical protein HHI36_011205 [Cryptolaemus montrouzieri]|uniref:AMP-dependent synthetase/ligase domain-containing protein n=1 Tax=Cryptolaemus montrouzieri TaxID=559131 RepID=A0ABD2MLE3_9CUCU